MKASLGWGRWRVAYLTGQETQLLSNKLDGLGLLSQSNGDITWHRLKQLQRQRDNGSLATLVQEADGGEVGVLHQHGNGHRANSTRDGGNMTSVDRGSLVLDISNPTDSSLLGQVWIKRGSTFQKWKRFGMLTFCEPRRQHRVVSKAGIK